MRTLNIALTFLFNIFFCMSLLAYDFDDLLSVNHTFENYYLKPVKKQSRAIASTPSLQKEEKYLSPFLDQGVNLDVNGNGKDDTWRTFKAGRLVSSKSDLNEDGKIDIRVEYDQYGNELRYLRDSNNDGNFDIKKKCGNQTCITLTDVNFDGKYDSKVVENYNKKLKRIFAKKGKAWSLLTELKIHSRAAQTEGKYVKCENCEPAITEQYKTELDLKQLSEMISEQFSAKAPPKIDLNNDGYFQATSKFGVLVHSSCNSQNASGVEVSFSDFKSKVDDALTEFQSCVEKMEDFSIRNDDRKGFDNFISTIYLRYTNLLNPIRPTALKPKIACVDMKKNPSKDGTKAEASAYIDDSSWDRSFSGSAKATLMGAPYVSFVEEESFFEDSITGTVKSTIVHELCHNLGYTHESLPDYCSAIDGLMNGCSNAADGKALAKSKVFLAAYNQLTMNEMHSFLPLDKYTSYSNKKAKANTLKKNSNEGLMAVWNFFSDHIVYAPSMNLDREKYLVRMLNESKISDAEKVTVIDFIDPASLGAEKAAKLYLEDKANGYGSNVDNSDVLATTYEKIYYYIYKNNGLNLNDPKVNSLLEEINYPFDSSVSADGNTAKKSNNLNAEEYFWAVVNKFIKEE